MPSFFIIEPAYARKISRAITKPAGVYHWARDKFFSSAREGAPPTFWVGQFADRANDCNWYFSKELTEESATWTTNSENEMATKRHKRRKNNDSFAHLAPSCGYPFVFHLAVLSVGF
jgi:hypothetical protein